MAIHEIRALLLSSLDRVFPEVEPEGGDVSELSCLKNEPLSFQVAYKLNSNQVFTVGVNLRIESDLPISLYSVGYLPVLQTRDTYHVDSYRAGLFGDMLLPKKTNPRVEEIKYPWESIYLEDDKTRLVARTDSWQSVWLTVNEDGKRLTAGSYPVKLTFLSMKDNAPLAECQLTIEIVDALLPKQSLLYTNWFHCDCLADMYGIEPFSERFWHVFADYVEKASRNGMNLLLTPCFTPPLDTPIGKERPTVQLVGVTVKGGEYSFDFSLLERYIDVAMANGITHFEHTHLFTQWGAKHAVKVMATVDGNYKRLFGWDTVAWGKKYQTFLRAYLTALVAFLKEKGVDRRFLYHVSDEPSTNVKENYRRAKRPLDEILSDYTVCDALSNYEFYADGTVKTPIVCTNHAEDFCGRVKDLWVYYTGGQATGGLANRKLNTTGERNRMLGVQLYMNDIKGFLHWGYNYWYGPLSQGIADPRTEPANFSGGSPGSAFIVYPATDGTCLQSIRQKIFYEAVNDMRALKRLETLFGKRNTHRLVEDYFGKVTFNTHLGDAEHLLAFRALVNEKIAELSAKK